MRCVRMPQPSDKLLARIHAHNRPHLPSASRGGIDILDFCLAAGNKLPAQRLLSASSGRSSGSASARQTTAHRIAKPNGPFR